MLSTEPNESAPYLTRQIWYHAIEKARNRVGWMPRSKGVPWKRIGMAVLVWIETTHEEEPPNPSLSD